MVQPRYNGIIAKDIPVIDEGDRKIRVISGSYRGCPGPAQGDYVRLQYLDVEMEPGTEWSLDTDKEDTLFVYIVQGGGSFGSGSENFVSAKRAVLFDQGRTFRVKAAEDGLRLLWLSAKPLKEPIAWGGPIVMNTREELNLAFQELKEDKFIKHPIG
jgi:hypothetical protein